MTTRNLNQSETGAAEDDSHLRLQLPSTLESVRRVESVALDFAHRAGFDEDITSHVAMVACEATANAVLHGNHEAPDKHVSASFLLDAERLTITVADEGEGMDPDALPDPLAPENLLRSSGRGVFLMRAMMDEVHFRQLSPGFEITLIKRRPAAVS